VRIKPLKPWDQKLDIYMVRFVVVVALLVLAAQVFLTGDPFEQSVEPAMSHEFTAPPRAVAARDFSKPVVTFKLKGFFHCRWPECL
jgi:hypothetical protein